MIHFRWSHYLMSSESESTDATTTDIDLKGHGLPFDWHARPRRSVPNTPGSSSRVYTEADAASTMSAASDDIDFHDAHDAHVDSESGRSEPAHGSSQYQDAERL